MKIREIQFRICSEGNEIGKLGGCCEEKHDAKEGPDDKNCQGSCQSCQWGGREIEKFNHVHGVAENEGDDIF